MSDDDNFIGVIIEESLERKDILRKVKILKTKIEEVTESHQTPWIRQWTLHTVEISKDDAENIAEDISASLDSQHSWYADFKNKNFHYVIFRNKIFKVDRSKTEQYHDVTKYGISLGIPDYQLDFSPHIEEWEMILQIFSYFMIKIKIKVINFSTSTNGEIYE